MNNMVLFQTVNALAEAVEIGAAAGVDPEVLFATMKDVESVLRELGADVSTAHSGKLHVALNSHSVNFPHAKHSLPKQEVIQVRKFLENCGVDPGRDYPL